MWSPNEAMSELPQYFLKPDDLITTSNFCKAHGHNPNAKQACCPSAVAVKDVWGIGTDLYNQSECQTTEAALTKIYRQIASFFESEGITEWWIDAGSLIAIIYIGP